MCRPVGGGRPRLHKRTFVAEQKLSSGLFAGVLYALLSLLIPHREGPRPGSRVLAENRHSFIDKNSE